LTKKQLKSINSQDFGKYKKTDLWEKVFEIDDYHAKATMVLNLFVNFLRFVVIFPNVFIPCKTTLFPLNSCSQFWGTLYLKKTA